MNREYLEIGLHLGSAWLAGSLIGLERSFHGRPAGFRTHALVCLASALLMVVTVYQNQWMTAVLGILYGIGFYYPALLTTAATLGTLAVFRWIEQRVPSQSFAHLTLRYRNTHAPGESRIREMLAAHGFTVSNVSYRLLDDAQDYEYRMGIKAYGNDAMARLADSLRASDDLVEFRLSPSGD